MKASMETKEVSPLLHSHEDGFHNGVLERRSMMRTARRTAITLVGLGMVTLLAFVAWSSGSSSKLKIYKSTSFEQISKQKNSAVSITITNEYSTLEKKMFNYPFLHDAWLMEPYRESLVTVTGLSDKCGFHWSLVKDSSTRMDSALESDIFTQGHVTNKNSFVVNTAGTGKFLLKIQQECMNHRYEFPVWIKYVRRELSSLTHRDREEFLDAMKVLWDVNTVDGRAIYGKNYKSLQYLASIHNDAGASGACDEFHTEPGFFNNHVLLGSYFEQSLQLVNPRTCLHYMEYTKYYELDAYKIGHGMNSNDGGTWTELMTSKWFGSNDPYTGLILDGRWAYSPVPFLNDDFFEAHGIDKYKVFFPDDGHIWTQGQERPHYFNPYGLLRSPWDFSSEPYVLRFNNVDRLEKTTRVNTSSVHCFDYRSFIQSYVVDKPLMEVMLMMEGRAHNGAHFGIAGAGGESSWRNDLKLREEFGFTDEFLVITTYEIQEFRKHHFVEWLSDAEGMLSCTPMPFDYESGTVSGADNSMKCSVSRKQLENRETINEFFASLYNEKSSLPVLEYISTMSLEKKIRLMELLGSREQYNGDLASSSAALDPIFWVLHGAVERLFQRIVFENVLTDLEYNYHSKCSGHTFNGTKAWLDGFKFEDHRVDVTILTNQDFTNIFNPRSELYAQYINFVYESKDWEWCNEFDAYFQK